jgi:hypothetical protein
VAAVAPAVLSPGRPMVAAPAAKRLGVCGALLLWALLVLSGRSTALNNGQAKTRERRNNPAAPAASDGCRTGYTPLSGIVRESRVLYQAVIEPPPA